MQGQNRFSQKAGIRHGRVCGSGRSRPQSRTIALARTFTKIHTIIILYFSIQVLLKAHHSQMIHFPSRGQYAMPKL